MSNQTAPVNAGSKIPTIAKAMLIFAALLAILIILGHYVYNQSLRNAPNPNGPGSPWITHTSP